MFSPFKIQRWAISPFQHTLTIWYLLQSMMLRTSNLHVQQSRSSAWATQKSPWCDWKSIFTDFCTVLLLHNPWQQTSWEKLLFWTQWPPPTHTHRDICCLTDTKRFVLTPCSCRWLSSFTLANGFNLISLSVPYPLLAHPLFPFINASDQYWQSMFTNRAIEAALKLERVRHVLGPNG